MIDHANSASRIALEQGDMRVSAPGIKGLQHLIPAIPAVKTALIVRGRYQTRPIPLPPASFIFRNDRPWPTIDARSKHTHVRLAPRLALTLAYRLIRRGQRIEAGPMPLQPQTEPPLARQVAPFLNGHMDLPIRQPTIAPVRREVRRAVRSEGENNKTLPSRYSPRDTIDDRQSRPAPRTMDAIPMDVNRLTDHVIQNIDRRIIAQRERFGRV